MRTFTAVIERCSDTGLYVGYVQVSPNVAAGFLPACSELANRGANRGRERFFENRSRPLFSRLKPMIEREGERWIA
jgi:hypothetical protein